MVDLSDEKLKELKASIPKQIGKRVRFFRKEKGITQTKLAQSIGKDRQYLYKIEKGKVTINILTLYIICIALEIPMNEFFNIELEN